jgi:hypothetical protein
MGGQGLKAKDRSEQAIGRIECDGKYSISVDQAKRNKKNMVSEKDKDKYVDPKKTEEKAIRGDRACE